MVNSMTEQEAKEKWCPMAQIAQGNNKDFGNCGASNCMMWRWNMIVIDDQKFKDICNAQDCSGIKCGYCGLAGKP